MFNHLFKQVTFLKSAAKLSQLPADFGKEVAFAGRSNAGKSSALNALVGIKRMAKTSKTPGCTQLINFFSLSATYRLVDLPGYGYAKVPLEIKQRWQETLAQYLHARQCLQGLVLVMDIRHPLGEFDQTMLDWATNANLPVHILLTKADKLSSSAIAQAVKIVKTAVEQYEHAITIQSFSSSKKMGVAHARHQLSLWFE